MSEDQAQTDNHETQKPERDADGRLSSNVGIMRRSIEFLGKHPFATGLLALLAIVGFLLSLYSYWQDRIGAQETTEQLTLIHGDVTDVLQNVSANCTSPPCWTLGDLMQAGAIGRSKDFIDSKLPPAEYVENNQSIHNIESCDVRIEYQNNGLSYISAALYRTDASEAGRPRRVACPFELSNILLHTPGPDHPYGPHDNASTKLQDVLDSSHDDVRLSIACIECGNFSDPFIEAFVPGTRAGGMVDIYVEVSYFGHDNADRGHDLWKQMQVDFDAVGPDPDEYAFVETSDYCGMNVKPQMAALMEFNVERVGIGRGTRVWSGPDALFCR